MHFSIIIISRQQCRDPNVLTNQCEGAWSTQGIYLTYVPTVTGITSPRIASVNEAPVITLVGHGFRSTATIETERQSKCVFVDVGLNTKVRTVARFLIYFLLPNLFRCLIHVFFLFKTPKQVIF